jgi:hypothetical protein
MGESGGEVAMVGVYVCIVFVCCGVVVLANGGGEVDVRVSVSLHGLCQCDDFGCVLQAGVVSVRCCRR